MLFSRSAVKTSLQAARSTISAAVKPPRSNHSRPFSTRIFGRTFSTPRPFVLRGLASAAAKQTTAVNPAPATLLSRKWALALLGGSALVALPLVSPEAAQVELTAARFLVALHVATLMLLEYKFFLGEQRPEETLEEYKERKSKIHLKAASHLLQGLRRNGGIYIKLGQHLSALVYLLPSEYTETLKILQSEAPRSSMEKIRQVFQEDWGRPLEDFFDDFDPEPLGSASLAQVHRARTKEGGHVVAIKIQHHGLDRFADGDLLTVEMMVKGIKYFFPALNFDWLADELKAGLPLEMNFVNEGRNAERAARQFSDDKSVVIPKIVWPLTSQRVLTMEFTPGRKISDVGYLHSHGIDPERVAAQVAKVFSRMIFCNGFVHADPHAGNIFVRPKEGGAPGDFEVVILDHGLYKDVDRDIRLHYARLWEAIISGNEKGMSEHAAALGAGHLYQLFSCMLTSRVWETVSGGDVSTNISLDEMSSLQAGVSDYFVEIADILSKVPRPLLLLMKTNDLLKSIEKELKSPNGNSYSIMGNYIVQAINEDTLLRDSSLKTRLVCHARLLRVKLRISLFQWHLWFRSKYGAPKRAVSMA